MRRHTGILQQCCILILVCTWISAFPTENSKSSAVTDSSKIDSGSTNASKNAHIAPVTIRTTLLPEDKKQFLSYVLGQRKKHASLKTPAYLMNPDKYEFYTFDDDGQIVKKLMSVQEIQRIIASNEKGHLHEPSNPVEYYQIITVQPDIEPPPAVSRINPNEPFFSIHDVIASVQNVLRSQIGLKKGQGLVTARPGQNETKTNETTTIVSPTATTRNVTLAAMTPTTTTALPTTLPEIQTEVENISEVDDLVKTSKPEKLSAETPPKQSNEVLQPIKATTYRPKPQTIKTKAEPAPFRLPETDSTTEEAPATELVESVPLSLSDAHPGLIKNETYLEPQASFVEQLSTFENDEGSTESTTEYSTTLATEEVEEKKPEITQNTINQMQIPINHDLAESVSSVLSQIASEISLGQFDASSLSTETAQIRNAEDEDNNNKKSENINIDEIYLTTEAPQVTLLAETTAENQTKVVSSIIESILKTQNQPRPFEKIQNEPTPDTTTEGKKPIDGTTTAATYESTTFNDFTYLPKLETTTKEEKLESKEGNIELEKEETVESLKEISETVTKGSDKPKPVPEKLIDAIGDKLNQTIEGVQIVPEGNIGKIPRPTETPGEVVKEIENVKQASDDTADKASVKAGVTELYSETTTETELEEETELNTESVETTTADESFETENLTDHQTVSENKAELKSSANEDTETGTTESSEAETRTEDSEPEVFDEAESKNLPEGNANAANQPSAQETSEKNSSATAPVQHGQDNQGSLKQNVPYKPFFSKPQKPVYIKPTKTKTPTDTKLTKPSSGKPTNNRDSVKETETKKPFENHFHSSPSTLQLEPAPANNLGLEATTINLDEDVSQFTDLCNELAFSLWSSITHNGLSFVRSVVVSPFAVTSLLAMVFLGARGPTSGQMNDVLKLDDMVTFNPHLVFRNVTESLVISRNPGVATAAFVRELYSDKSKGKLLDFYKERAQQFYDGYVEEVNFKTVADTLRRQTNHLVKRQTWGKITDFLRGSNLHLRPPLAAFSANIFQTDCTKASTKDRDGEMYFVILPASRLRRLVPVPAVVWRDNFMAGYEPNMDATVVAINPPDSVVSTIFIMPGQQGLIAPGDTLARLEHHLLGSDYRRGHWSRLMRSLMKRPGLEVQIPRLSHRSVINVTTSLQRMGLRDLFNAEKADLTGLNGLANDLHLSDMLQVNLFSTCAEDGIGSRHISEVYPASPLLRREKSLENLFSESIENLFAVSDFEDPSISAMPLELRPRQARIPLSKPGARIPEPPRLRYDRPFLFFVRHNPTGLVLHVGRFNPRLTT